MTEGYDSNVVVIGMIPFGLDGLLGMADVGARR